MNCPNCKVALVMSERQGIEIDYCPNCRGIWLDRGELDKIIEKSSQPVNNLDFQSRPHFDDHKQHDYYKHQRKKNWLNELFD